VRAQDHDVVAPAGLGLRDYLLRDLSTKITRMSTVLATPFRVTTALPSAWLIPPIGICPGAPMVTLVSGPGTLLGDDGGHGARGGVLTWTLKP
jgi:hypothetical protein